MGLSSELQIGKAGEHLVCCDLIENGYNEFLADAGLPYDVLLDFNGDIKRIQVKTTSKVKSNGVYRFYLRCAKKAARGISVNNIDLIAFVFLDRRIVQYVPVTDVASRNGILKQTIDFYERGNRKYVVGRFSLKRQLSKVSAIKKMNYDPQYKQCNLFGDQNA